MFVKWLLFAERIVLGEETAKLWRAMNKNFARQGFAATGQSLYWGPFAICTELGAGIRFVPRTENWDLSQTIASLKEPDDSCRPPGNTGPKQLNSFLPLALLTDTQTSCPRQGASSFPRQMCLREEARTFLVTSRKAQGHPTVRVKNRFWWRQIIWKAFAKLPYQL